MRRSQNHLIQKELFGFTKEGTPVYQFTLESESGMICKVINYGAIIRELWVPDKKGELIDVVLGFDSLEEYEEQNGNYYLGSIIGRYANRIAKGTISINGRTYHLPINDNDRPNTLHGGPRGFHTKVFDAFSDESGSNSVSLILKYTSKDGEEGFPGNLDVAVIYRLVNSELSVEYIVTTDKPTVINLTQHSYFNLSGQETILDHYLMINADSFTPVDEYLIPTGEIKPVEGGPFDLRKPRKIGEALRQLFHTGLTAYDQNFVLNGETGETKFAAQLFHEETGIELKIYTTQPGLQLYTGNYLLNVHGKGGRIYNNYAGVCLETQNFPDAPNHKNFPSALLLPGQLYNHRTVYKFSNTRGLSVCDRREE
ncbi:MAG: aldose epimerase family protein [Pseudothermotoga sp.]